MNKIFILSTGKAQRAKRICLRLLFFLFPPTHPALISDITGEKGSEGGGGPPRWSREPVGGSW